MGMVLLHEVVCQKLVVEGCFVHDLAGYAPFGVEIDEGHFALGGGGLECVVEGAGEVLNFACGVSYA
jgi:hypothetical protein